MLVLPNAWLIERRFLENGKLRVYKTTREEVRVFWLAQTLGRQQKDVWVDTTQNIFTILGPDVQSTIKLVHDLIA